ncbi:MAG: SPOR domain-containing protein [Candidatus Zhuqueibacterota bacterium]
MRHTILSKKIFIFWLLLTIQPLPAQDQFTLFTVFDQLHWAPGRTQVAFRCLLLDESQPSRIQANVLLKDIAGDKLMCLNPAAESFAISSDKKWLLFSGVYGLYLMELNRPGSAAHIYFRNPASPWIFQDFGFFDAEAKIFINRYHPSEEKTIAEVFELQPVQFEANRMTACSLETVKKKRSWRPSNLVVNRIGERRPDAWRFKGRTLRFQPSPDSPDEFHLIDQADENSSRTSRLLDACRPQLVSQSPNREHAVFSVLRENHHVSYIYSANQGRLTQLLSERLTSMAWVNSTSYLCINEHGLFLRDIQLNVNRRLDEFELPAWCQGIELELPRYELQVGFENDRAKADHMASRLRELGFDGRLIFHKNRFQTGYDIRVGGFVTKKAARAERDRLEQHGFTCRVDSISDSYDYFNRPWPEETKTSGDYVATIQYAHDGYLRSRIMLRTGSRSRRILVDEMNTIPNRAEWK